LGGKGHPIGLPLLFLPDLVYGRKVDVIHSDGRPPTRGRCCKNATSKRSLSVFLCFTPHPVASGSRQIVPPIVSSALSDEVIECPASSPNLFLRMPGEMGETSLRDDRFHTTLDLGCRQSGLNIEPPPLPCSISCHERNTMHHSHPELFAS